MSFVRALGLALALGVLLVVGPAFALDVPSLDGRVNDHARLLSPDRAASLETRPSDSGGRRADEGFWVAALPFKYAGSNADVAGLAEGLSEEIVTGLSRFSYLRVIARSSTSKYASPSRTTSRRLML